MGNSNGSTTRYNLSTFPPTPVKQNGIEIKLLGQPFLGCPQIFQISRNGGVQMGDYVEFYVGDFIQQTIEHGRIISGSLNFGVHAGESSIAIVKYFGDAKLLAQMRYTLRNPIKSFSMINTVEIGQSISISYSLYFLPPSSAIRLSVNGVCLHRMSLQNLQDKINIPTPRLPGKYDIEFLGSDGIELKATNIDITDRQRRSNTTLSFKMYGEDHRIFNARPYQSIELLVGGPSLKLEDKLIIIKVINKDIFTKPTAVDAVFPHKVCFINSHGVCSLLLSEEGVFQVCIGLVHESGASLLGDWVTVIISDRVGMTTETNSSNNEANTTKISTKPSIMSSKNTATLNCIICFDVTITTKLEPCRHVCLCEPCANSIMKSGNGNCPICRKNISKLERIYLS